MGRKSAHRDAQPWLQKARRAPLSPAIAPAHTALRSRQRPPPAERRAGHPAPASSQAAHPTACAGLCGAHTHTQRGGATRGGRAAPGTATRPHGTQFLRSGRTGGVPARPRPPTAHNCMAHPVPHTTRQRHPRRPHRVACTIGPSPLGTAAHARINHAVQGRPRTAAAQHERQKPAPAAAHHTACARRSPLGRPSLCPRTDFAAPGAATPAPKASCAMHCTPLAQDLQRLTTPAPPLPARCTLPQHSTRAYGCD